MVSCSAASHECKGMVHSTSNRKYLLRTFQAQGLRSNVGTCSLTWRFYTKAWRYCWWNELFLCYTSLSVFQVSDSKALHPATSCLLPMAPLVGPCGVTGEIKCFHTGHNPSKKVLAWDEFSPQVVVSNLLPVNNSTHIDLTGAGDYLAQNPLGLF